MRAAAIFATNIWTLLLLLLAVVAAAPTRPTSRSSTQKPSSRNIETSTRPTNRRRAARRDLDILDLTAEPQFVHSPTFPRNYTEDTFFEWRLQAPTGSVVQITFLVFETELNVDLISLFDGLETKEELLIAR